MWCLKSLGVCVLFCGAVLAGEPRDTSDTSKAGTLPKTSTPASGTALLKPAPNAQAVPKSGRRNLEAQLLAPADLDFGPRQRISAREVLDQLHERHHLSIRFDVPTLASLFGSEPVALKRSQVAGQPFPSACYVGNEVAVQRYSNAPVVASAPVVSAATAPAAPSSTVPAAAAPASTAAPAPSAASAAPAVAAPVRITDPAPALSKDGSAPQPLGESNSEPLSQPESVPPTKSEKSPEPKEMLTHLLDVEIDVQMIDLKSVSVATVLRHVLDAAPLPAGAEDFLGLPIPLTNAMLLDYLVEADGLLITTRMRALTHKETRVYSVKHLTGLPSEQLARTIRQAVRPWSWRSQITDMGDQLKGTPLPPETLGAILKTGALLVGSDLGTTLTIADSVPVPTVGAPVPFAVPSEVSSPVPYATPQLADSDGAPPAYNKKESQTDETKAAAMVGNAMVNGLVTFLQATLASLEMFHYAEPPTATVQTLPGKLVITQSQTAHREIAQLLEQLAEE